MENLSAFLSEVIRPSEITTPTEPYFDVTKHGVVGDGVTNNTKAINELIKSVSGGIIFFPPGRYLTGTIMLKSNMTLYLTSGADCKDMELFDFGPRPLADDTPVMEDISINNVMVRRATVAAMYIFGIPERPIKNLRVHNFSVESVIDPAIRRESVMMPTFEKMQGKGIIIKNVSDSVFSEILVTTENVPLEYENLENVTFNGKTLAAVPQ